MSWCTVYVGCLCGAYPRVTFYGMTTKGNLVTIWCRHSHKLLQGSCRCIVSCKAWVRVGSYVHVHTHANYHTVMKVAEGYRNVWKLCIFWLVWVNLNHHTVQVAWGCRTTVGLLQSVCVCCYHTIDRDHCSGYNFILGCGSCKYRMPSWVLHRHVKAYTHSEPDYSVAVTD